MELFFKIIIINTHVAFFIVAHFSFSSFIPSLTINLSGQSSNSFYEMYNNCYLSTIWRWIILALIIFSQTEACPPISLLYVVYHDIDLAEVVLEAILPYISEIVVVDGPRSGMIPLLRSQGLFYHRLSSTVRKFFRDWSKIHPNITLKYHYEIWEDEFKQRIFGYSECSGPIVLQAEGDFLMKLDKEKLSSFCSDPTKGVGAFETVNLVDVDVIMSSQYFIERKTLPRVPYIFKKSLVGASEYLNYLWLVGPKRKQPDKSLLFPAPVGLSLHYTLVRSLQSASLKYSFYVSNYYAVDAVEKSEELQTLVNTLTFIQSEYDDLTAMEVFARLRPESGICMPGPSNQRFLSKAPGRVQDLIDHFGVKNSPIPSLCDHKYFDETLPVFHGITSWISLRQLDTSSISLSLQNILECRVTVVDYVLGKSPLTVSESTLKNNSSNVVKFSFPRDKYHDVYIRAISFTCRCREKTRLGWISDSDNVQVTSNE